MFVNANPLIIPYNWFSNKKYKPHYNSIKIVFKIENTKPLYYRLKTSTL